MAVEGKGLGRLPAADERDRRFSVAHVLSVLEYPPRTYRYWWSNGWWGDQGDTSMCVEYSWHHFMTDGPVTHGNGGPVWEVGSLYHAAQLVDEWPGEDYDGTSVRAGAKVLQDQGKITEYRWAFSVNDIVNTVLNVSPMVVGTNWYTKMYDPDRNHMISVSGGLDGGHAYLINGVNTKKRIFRIKNSWGRSWGINGHAFITFDDFAKLLDEDGEACIALETAY